MEIIRLNKTCIYQTGSFSTDLIFYNIPKSYGEIPLLFVEGLSSFLQGRTTNIHHPCTALLLLNEARCYSTKGPQQTIISIVDSSQHCYSDLKRCVVSTPSSYRIRGERSKETRRLKRLRITEFGVEFNSWKRMDWCLQLEHGAHRPASCSHGLVLHLYSRLERTQQKLMIVFIKDYFGESIHCLVCKMKSQMAKRVDYLVVVMSTNQRY